MYLFGARTSIHICKCYVNNFTYKYIQVHALRKRIVYSCCCCYCQFAVTLKTMSCAKVTIWLTFGDTKSWWSCDTNHTAIATKRRVEASANSSKATQCLNCQLDCSWLWRCNCWWYWWKECNLYACAHLTHARSCIHKHIHIHTSTDLRIYVYMNICKFLNLFHRMKATQQMFSLLLLLLWEPPKPAAAALAVIVVGMQFVGTWSAA